MPKEPKIISIVVTYNADHWIDKCFGSLIKSTIQNHTILAIDNSSKDNTVENITKRYPQVIIIKNGKNLGFGKANNIGLRRAIKEKADYVFLLNQDAWVNKDTIKNLIEISKANTNYGIVSPVHLNSKDSVDAGFAYYCLKNLQSEFIFDSFCSSNLKKIYPASFINAAAWLLTKECINHTGGFMPIFPHYGEDTNYCERVLSSGLQIGFTPGNTIVHERNLQKRQIPLKKQITQMYVHFLVIFTSNKKRGTKAYINYCLTESLRTLKIYNKRPHLVFLIPFTIFYIFLFKTKQISIQRKQAQKIHTNFLD